MSQALTARERVLRAICRERVRPVPVGAVIQSATLSQMEALSARWPDAHLDPELMAALAEGARTLLDFDMVRVPFDQTIEAELIGAEVDYGDEASNCSIRSHPLTIGDPVPSFPNLSLGRAKVVQEALSMLKKRLRGDAALIGGVVGPFTLVSQLAGTAAVLMTALRNPTALRPYLDFASKVGNEYARRQFDAGADAVCIEDMGASLDLTSPSIYRNLILPAQREMITGIGAPVILHICGSNTKILDLLSSTGAAALGLEAKTDLALAVRATECSIIGGVAPIEVLLSGEPPDVYRASIDCLVAGVHAVAPGCGLAARTPMENLREMTRAAREWET